MGRPLGSKNLVTKETIAKAEKLLAKYGSPLEKVLRIVEFWSQVRESELSKSSRHRNLQKVREAEDKIYRGAELTANYFHAKHASVQQQTEVKALHAVIRAPAPCKTTEEWLQKYRPKHLQPQSETPVMTALLQRLDDESKN